MSGILRLSHVELRVPDLELAAAYCMSKGIHYKKALGVAVLANWGAFYGNTSVIYISEILGGFRYIEDRFWGFWLKFVGLNLQWSTVSPMAAIGALWLLSQRSKAEALAEAGERSTQ